MTALTLDNVSVRFGGLHALRDIQMSIAQGERRSIIGPNGAGKSTLFNVIAGDVRATSGRVLLNDSDVTRTPVYRRVALGLRRTYQTSALFDSLTVAQNLYLSVLGPLGRGHLDFVRPDRDPRITARAEETARAVRMSSRLAVKAGDLSHGERRQLEIGMALAFEPQIVILDEPAAGLSANEREVLTDLLLALDRNVTILLIEHDMDVALTVGEIVTVLHDGAVIAEGPPGAISENPMVQKVYLGDA